MTGVASHVRGGTSGWPLRSWHFLVRGSSVVPTSGPGPPSTTSPYLARPLTSILASGGPPRLLGILLPSQSGGPEGRLWLLRDPLGALSLVLTQGKGCVWQKQLYKYGYGERSSARVT